MSSSPLADAEYGTSREITLIEKLNAVTKERDQLREELRFEMRASGRMATQLVRLKTGLVHLKDFLEWQEIGNAKRLIARLEEEEN